MNTLLKIQEQTKTKKIYISMIQRDQRRRGEGPKKIGPQSYTTYTYYRYILKLNKKC